MNKPKLKLKQLLSVSSCVFLTFIFYTVIVFFSLQSHSEFLQQEFAKNKMEGKSIQEFVRVFGKPKDIDYIAPWQYDMTTYETKLPEPYYRLTYYTGNNILDNVGWFPCGGTKIFADKDSKITKIKQACY